MYMCSQMSMFICLLKFVILTFKSAFEIVVVRIYIYTHYVLCVCMRGTYAM